MKLIFYPAFVSILMTGCSFGVSNEELLELNRSEAKYIFRNSLENEEIKIRNFIIYDESVKSLNEKEANEISQNINLGHIDSDQIISSCFDFLNRSLKKDDYEEIMRDYSVKNESIYKTLDYKACVDKQINSIVLSPLVTKYFLSNHVLNTYKEHSTVRETIETVKRDRKITVSEAILIINVLKQAQDDSLKKESSDLLERI